MLGKNLSNEDKYLLNIIYRYGGYIRVKHLKYLYPDMSERAYSYKLDKLADIQCLTKRRYMNNSKREPVTYQITQAGCNICGNINSTFRRKRPPEYAYRALHKNAFFLELHSELSDFVINNVNDRKSIFESSGFNIGYYPKKLNRDKTNNVDVSMVQFEEYILDFRVSNNKKISYKNDVLYSDNDNGIIITYFDQPHIEINKQVVTLVNRYIMMINQYIHNNIGFRIDFLVIVDSENRYNMYQVFLEKFLSNAKYQDRISDKLLLLYVTFYEKLAKKDPLYTFKYNHCYDEYKRGILRNKFNERGKYFKAENNDKYIFFLEQIKLLGINFLSDKIYNTIKSNENDLETGRIKVEELFDIVSSMEYKNELYLDENQNKMKYNIKLYQTEISIYD